MACGVLIRIEKELTPEEAYAVREAVFWAFQGCVIRPTSLPFLHGTKISFQEATGACLEGCSSTQPS